jgi:hypothetical protein
MSDGKQPMATWIKVLIVVAIVGGVSGVLVLIAGGVFMVNSVRQAMDPKVAAEVTSSIAKIADPLPEGFKRSVAVNIGGTAEATFATTDGKMILIMMKMPAVGPNRSADVLVDEYIKRGGPEAGSENPVAKFHSPLMVQSKGKLKVAGEDMPYIIGTRNINGTMLCQLIGYVVPKRTSQPIFIMSQCSRTSDMDMERTKKFLGGIESF